MINCGDPLYEALGLLWKILASGVAISFVAGVVWIGIHQAQRRWLKNDSDDLERLKKELTSCKLELERLTTECLIKLSVELKMVAENQSLKQQLSDRDDRVNELRIQLNESLNANEDLRRVGSG